jgi:ubiquinone/menaquinone biosynthesis C-methylase UbiE
MNMRDSGVEESPSQNLKIYSDPDFAESLETWGEGNAWVEIQFLVAGCKGKILDIACGTGKVMETLDKFPGIDLYGCDISEFLIRKAINRGLDKNRLKICDAIKMDYPDNFFNFSYSIGSLEHFTENGIEQCIYECHRVTEQNSFHLVPVSRSGRDEGWITTVQSYYNNSMDWWIKKFSRQYKDIIVLDSRWNDDHSVGKWFICLR